MAFDKESKRKLLSLMSADNFFKHNLDFRVEISLCLNGKFFDFRKTPFSFYEFSVAINVFL